MRARERFSLTERASVTAPTERASAQTTAAPTAEPDTPGPAPILVLYHPTAAGRAALLHAARCAQATGAPLTVLSVTPQEHVTLGCARCHQSAAIWNTEMAEVAEEDLAEAAKLLEPLEFAEVGYLVGRGERAPAVAAAARRTSAGMVVVPWERSLILGVFPRRTLAARLAAQAGVNVCSGPRPSASRGDRGSGDREADPR